MTIGITVKCIKTDDYNRKFLTVGEEYMSFNIISNAIEIVGNDNENHIVPMEFFELVSMSRGLKVLFEGLSTLQNQHIKRELMKSRFYRVPTS